MMTAMKADDNVNDELAMVMVMMMVMVMAIKRNLDSVPLVSNPGVGLIGGKLRHHVSV